MGISSTTLGSLCLITEKDKVGIYWDWERYVEQFCAINQWTRFHFEQYCGNGFIRIPHEQTEGFRHEFHKR